MGSDSSADIKFEQLLREVKQQQGQNSQGNSPGTLSPALQSPDRQSDSTQGSHSDGGPKVDKLTSLSDTPAATNHNDGEMFKPRADSFFVAQHPLRSSSREDHEGVEVGSEAAEEEETNQDGAVKQTLVNKHASQPPGDAVDASSTDDNTNATYSFKMWPGNHDTAHASSDIEAGETDEDVQQMEATAEHAQFTFKTEAMKQTQDNAAQSGAVGLLDDDVMLKTPPLERLANDNDTVLDCAYKDELEERADALSSRSTTFKLGSRKVPEAEESPVRTLPENRVHSVDATS